MLTWVYLKTRKVKMEAGAQQTARRIHIGLVNTINTITQKARPSSVSITLDWRNISRTKIMENSMNFNRNLASYRALQTIRRRNTYFLWAKMVNNWMSAEEPTALGYSTF